MATKTVVGLFETDSDAQAALQDLRDAGFSGEDISLVANNSSGTYDDIADDNSSEAEEGAGFGATGGAVLGGLGGLLVGLGALVIPGVGPVIAAGTLATALGTTALGAGIGAAAGGLTGALVGSGIPEEDAHVYTESVRRGDHLITVRASDDDQAQRAADIMNSNNVVDIDDRGEEFRSSGWTRFDETAEPYDLSQRRTTATTGAAAPMTRDVDTTVSRTADVDRTTTRSTDVDREGDMVIPKVEEELHVGKRAVERGGVRVRSYVEQVPVDEQVTLRDETVDVERRPVNREASAADIDAFQEGTFEVREHDEEAVVDKQARVVEEIRVHKGAEQHTETIHDTVRRTEVEVEQLGDRDVVSSDVDVTGTTGTTSTTGTTGTHDEGAIERGASKLGNAVERGTGADIDRDGDVGRRDPRNNI